KQHPNLDPRVRRLNFTKSEKAALIAFLKTLSDEKFRDCSKESGKSSLSSCLVQAGGSRLTTGRLLIALQVKSQSAFQPAPASHPVHALLHLPVTAVAALDRVGGRRHEPVIQEHQSLLQVGRLQLVQAPPQ